MIGFGYTFMQAKKNELKEITSNSNSAVGNRAELNSTLFYFYSPATMIDTKSYCHENKPSQTFPVDTMMSTLLVPVPPLPYVYMYMYTNVHTCAYILYYTCTVVGGTYIFSEKNNVCPSWGQINCGIIRDVIGVLFSYDKKITELYLHH